MEKLRMGGTDKGGENAANPSTEQSDHVTSDSQDDDGEDEGDSNEEDTPSHSHHQQQQQQQQQQKLEQHQFDSSSASPASDIENEERNHNNKMASPITVLSNDMNTDVTRDDDDIVGNGGDDEAEMEDVEPKTSVDAMGGQGSSYLNEMNLKKTRIHSGELPLPDNSTVSRNLKSDRVVSHKDHFRKKRRHTSASSKAITATDCRRSQGNENDDIDDEEIVQQSSTSLTQHLYSQQSHKYINQESSRMDVTNPMTSSSSLTLSGHHLRKPASSFSCHTSSSPSRIPKRSLLSPENMDISSAVVAAAAAANVDQPLDLSVSTKQEKSISSSSSSPSPNLSKQTHSLSSSSPFHSLLPPPPPSSFPTSTLSSSSNGLSSLQSLQERFGGSHPLEFSRRTSSSSLLPSSLLSSSSTSTVIPLQPSMSTSLTLSSPSSSATVSAPFHPHQQRPTPEEILQLQNLTSSGGSGGARSKINIDPITEGRNKKPRSPNTPSSSSPQLLQPQILKRDISSPNSKHISSTSSSSSTSLSSSSLSSSSSSVPTQFHPEDESSTALSGSSGVRSKHTIHRCSCHKSFNSLYSLSLHIQDTGHTPLSGKALSLMDYPKLVRGQDMWLNQESEQTRRILRCMQCGESFKSLPLLTVHMMQTQHHTKIVSFEHGRRSHKCSTYCDRDLDRECIFKCKVCHDAFPDMEGLANHMIVSGHHKAKQLPPVSRAGGLPHLPPHQQPPPPSLSSSSLSSASTATAHSENNAGNLPFSLRHGKRKRFLDEEDLEKVYGAPFELIKKHHEEVERLVMNGMISKEHQGLESTTSLTSSPPLTPKPSAIPVATASTPGSLYLNSKQVSCDSCGKRVEVKDFDIHVRACLRQRAEVIDALKSKLAAEEALLSRSEIKLLRSGFPISPISGSSASSRVETHLPPSSASSHTHQNTEMNDDTLHKSKNIPNKNVSENCMVQNRNFDNHDNNRNSGLSPQSYSPSSETQGTESISETPSSTSVKMCDIEVPLKKWSSSDLKEKTSGLCKDDTKFLSRVIEGGSAVDSDINDDHRSDASTPGNESLRNNDVVAKIKREVYSPVFKNGGQIKSASNLGDDFCNRDCVDNFSAEGKPISNKINIDSTKTAKNREEEHDFTSSALHKLHMFSTGLQMSPPKPTITEETKMSTSSSSAASNASRSKELAESFHRHRKNHSKSSRRTSSSSPSSKESLSAGQSLHEKEVKSETSEDEAPSKPVTFDIIDPDAEPEVNVVSKSGALEAMESFIQKSFSAKSQIRSSSLASMFSPFGSCFPLPGSLHPQQGIMGNSSAAADPSTTAYFAKFSKFFSMIPGASVPNMPPSSSSARYSSESERRSENSHLSEKRPHISPKTTPTLKVPVMKIPNPSSNSISPKHSKEFTKTSGVENSMKQKLNKAFETNACSSSSLSNSSKKMGLKSSSSKPHGPNLLRGECRLPSSDELQSKRQDVSSSSLRKRKLSCDEKLTPSKFLRGEEFDNEKNTDRCESLDETNTKHSGLDSFRAFVKPNRGIKEEISHEEDVGASEKSNDISKQNYLYNRPLSSDLNDENSVSGKRSPHMDNEHETKEHMSLSTRNQRVSINNNQHSPPLQMDGVKLENCNDSQDWGRYENSREVDGDGKNYIEYDGRVREASKKPNSRNDEIAFNRNHSCSMNDKTTNNKEDGSVRNGLTKHDVSADSRSTSPNSDNDQAITGMDFTIPRSNKPKDIDDDDDDDDDDDQNDDDKDDDGDIDGVEKNVECEQNRSISNCKDRSENIVQNWEESDSYSLCKKFKNRYKYKFGDREDRSRDGFCMRNRKMKRNRGAASSDGVKIAVRRDARDESDNEFDENVDNDDDDNDNERVRKLNEENVKEDADDDLKNEVHSGEDGVIVNNHKEEDGDDNDDEQEEVDEEEPEVEDSKKRRNKNKLQKQCFSVSHENTKNKAAFTNSFGESTTVQKERKMDSFNISSTGSNSGDKISSESVSEMDIKPKFRPNSVEKETEEESETDTTAFPTKASALDSLSSFVYSQPLTSEHPLDSLQRLFTPAGLRRASVEGQGQQSTPLSPPHHPHHPASSGCSSTQFELVGVTSEKIQQVALRNGSPSPLNLAVRGTERTSSRSTSHSLDGNDVNSNDDEHENDDGDDGSGGSSGAAVGIIQDDGVSEEEGAGQDCNGIEFKCAACNRRFASKGSYRYHLSRCHLSSVKKYGIKEAFNMSPYVYLPLDHTAKFSKYYQMAQELASKGK